MSFDLAEFKKKVIDKLLSGEVDFEDDVKWTEEEKEILEQAIRSRFFPK